MISSQSPYLILRTESGNRYLPLTTGQCWTVGRSEDNTLVLADRWISRNHAMLQWMETGEFYLIDLGSRNGSFVNGRRVNIPITLQNGDRLTFGQTELEFYLPLDMQVAPVINSDEPESSATALLHVRRLISVVVIDIRDFTVLTRQLDEQILSEVIGTWFRHAGNIIRENGSWVDKYIGDAVMAVWIHSPNGVTSDEMWRLFQALDAMNRVTNDLNQKYPLPFPLRIGAGVNTGYAMVGNTGSGDRPDYTALGDTVNAAFRLESSTKQLGLDVALGQTTFEQAAKLGVSANLFQQHLVNLKGYESPTLTYACNFATLRQWLQSQPRLSNTPNLSKPL